MAVHRGRRLEDWVELAAAAIERARTGLGDAEVARRVEGSVSEADYQTAVRVLRAMGRDLQATAPDLTALDARLRSGAVEHAPASSPEAKPGFEPEHEPKPRPEPKPTPGTPESSEEPAQDAPPTLDELSSQESAALTHFEMARKLVQLRNPILPHPRHGRGV